MSRSIFRRIYTNNHEVLGPLQTFKFKHKYGQHDFKRLSRHETYGQCFLNSVEHILMHTKSLLLNKTQFESMANSYFMNSIEDFKIYTNLVLNKLSITSVVKYIVY